MGLVRLTKIAHTRHTLTLLRTHLLESISATVTVALFTALVTVTTAPVRRMVRFWPFNVVFTTSVLFGRFSAYTRPTITCSFSTLASSVRLLDTEAGTLAKAALTGANTVKESVPIARALVRLVETSAATRLDKSGVALAS